MQRSLSCSYFLIDQAAAVFKGSFFPHMTFISCPMDQEGLWFRSTTNSAPSFADYRMSEVKAGFDRLDEWFGRKLRAIL